MKPDTNLPVPIQPLCADTFSHFGDVIELQAKPSMWINRGNCARHHDLATLDFTDARAGISLFHASPYSLPHPLDMMERHPLGSQAFIPMSSDPFLIISALDHNNRPARPQAFISNGKQAVNYHRGCWHAVLTPLHREALFAVVDRIGEGNNLQEHWFDTPYDIVDANGLCIPAPNAQT